MIGLKTFAQKLVAYMDATAGSFEEASKKNEDPAGAQEDMTIARVLRVMSRIITAVAEI